MIIIEKNCYLKKEIDPEKLREFGFVSYNNGDSYWFDILSGYGKSIAYYNNTRRFVIRYPGFRDGRYRKVLKYIKLLQEKGLIEIRKTAIVMNMNPFTNYRDWSDEKVEKWEKKASKVQAKLDAKYNAKQAKKDRKGK